jgi:hypothetical protein
VRHPTRQKYEYDTLGSSLFAFIVLLISLDLPQIEKIGKRKSADSTDSQQITPTKFVIWTGAQFAPALFVRWLKKIPASAGKTIGSHEAFSQLD